jgi:hypothetical protein
MKPERGGLVLIMTLVAGGLNPGSNHYAAHYMSSDDRDHLSPATAMSDAMRDGCTAAVAIPRAHP